ncbi:hypothetical protein EXIGLDRAFT_772924 [Exidia glandulosa HHB12029]|uniref:Uncharacterized protein n=1 Tax=Exidia glandulosa HHB12029 TaxID=1314781 RepID=A0A165F289_EXIGL|nr:hypothetical protein EXIGLDRAFT_772924 [Exidia glandulosa HHB12029]
MAKAIVLPGKDDIVVQDDNADITYTPVDKWSSVSNDNLFGGTGQITTTYLAEFSFTFTGSALWYYGDLNDDHGRFSVMIDDVEYPTISGAAPLETPRILLFYTELSQGSHTFTVRCLQNGAITVLDWLVYRPNAAPATDTSQESSTSNGTSESFSPSMTDHPYATSSPDSEKASDIVSSPSSTAPPKETAPHHNLSTAQAIGIGCASTAVLLLCIGGAAVLLHMRRKRAQKRKRGRGGSWPFGPAYAGDAIDDRQQLGAVEELRPFPLHPEPAVQLVQPGETEREQKRHFWGVVDLAQAGPSTKETSAVN